MVIQDILRLVENDGYQRVASNLPELCLYHKMVKERSLYLLVTDTHMNGSQSPQAVRGLMLQICYKLKQREQDCEFLTIIIADQVMEYRELVGMNQVVWLVDRAQQRLLVYENQKECFTELRMQIEHLFDHYFTMGQTSGIEQQSAEESEGTSGLQRTGAKSFRQRSQEVVKQWPIGCSILVVLNVLIYLITYHILGVEEYNVIMHRFGVQWNAITGHHEYYRLFTYMFLHFGVDHLFNNMLVLFFVGKSLEMVIPRIKFFVIYFGAGILAGAVSMGYNRFHENNVLSAGASGAIFGLIGAMLYVVLINRGRLCKISTRQILLFVVFSLYGGFASANVDNAAHIGGFIGGVLIAAILIRREGKKRGKVSES